MTDIARVDDAVELRDVRGPSALGGGWRRLVDLVLLISVTEFKRTYFGTALGYLWSIARPGALRGALVVFTQVFRRVDRPALPGPAALQLRAFRLLLRGHDHRGDIRGGARGHRPQDAVPASGHPAGRRLTAFFNLALNLVVVFVFILPFGITPMWTWLLLPLVLLALSVLTIAVSMILSSLYPRFRDIGIIWTVFSTAPFYATPVLYPLERAPEWLRKIIILNPITEILELARRWVIDPSAPHLSDIAGSKAILLLPAAIYVTTCVVAVWVFNREAPRIAEKL